eukprot:TRINITY_DN22267_c1_g1_i1.p1 TRINITY_DN22267_c1_g1~~TRINITY_DN22267_c1_g1_i1.p1  ORF type:complete len:236 (-),score=40.82 TRINITY_DN22267_c1_g1_i1:98-805(-)
MLAGWRGTTFLSSMLLMLGSKHRRRRCGCHSALLRCSNDTVRSTSPKVVVAISGKRKTGKDFFYEMLMEELAVKDEDVETRRFATPIKAHIASKFGVELEDLETSGPLKEKFRSSFYEYDLAERAKDPFVFAREVLQDVSSQILVISDLRQIGDYQYLRQHYSDRLILIRLDAGEELRETRGYRFTPGVDDCAVECDLDDDRISVPWTLRWENDGDDTKWPQRLKQACDMIQSYL